MNILANVGYAVFVTIIAIVAIAGDIHAYMQLSPGKQKEKVQEWLLAAVIKAEKMLGGGTGQLKLRTVYDMFIEKFPSLVKAISFEEFSDMVDVALEKMKDLIKNNDRLRKYIESGVNDISIDKLIEMIVTLKK